ncbi:MAG TPA: hypothetical protein VI754_01750 [Bacteriovoracaceae bacterium]|nr:hypothetical protein [Bacteriovoracaceae bacterium]
MDNRVIFYIIILHSLLLGNEALGADKLKSASTDFSIESSDSVDFLANELELEERMPTPIPGKERLPKKIVPVRPKSSGTAIASVAALKPTVSTIIVATPRPLATATSTPPPLLTATPAPTTGPWWNKMVDNYKKVKGAALEVTHEVTDFIKQKLGR